MTKKFTAFILGILATVGGIFPSTVFDISASAEEIGTQQITTFEKTDINDDLQDIDVSTYLQNPLGDVEVLRFVEYCYSEKAFFSQYYGLYVYIYNPTQTALDIEGNTSKVNMAVEYDTTGTPTDYKNVALEYCDHTDNNRFYKFKLSNSAEYYDVAKAYAAENEGERRYDIVGIQLRQVSGGILTDEIKTANDKKHEKTYYFKGYSKGCGADSSAESTLTCRYDDLETVGLEVHPTQYRPQGTNATNNYTKDCLHSVYFSVPNEYIENYGEMSEIHATWKNAVTAPIFVTGNKSVYNQVLELLGDYVDGGKVQDGGKNNDMDYALIATKAQIGYRDTVEAAVAGYIAYNVLNDFCGINTENYYDNLLSYLYFAFYAENGDADNYTVSSEQVLSELKNSASKYGGELVNGRYSSKMFSSYDSNFTEVNIKADENRSLTSEVISQTWWEKLLGLDGSIADKTTYDDIQAIYPIQSSDLKGTPEEISKRLYIDKTDVADLKALFSQKGDTNTVYLFRYMQSEYTAHEVTEYKHTTDWAVVGGNFNTYEAVDTNAYFAQMSVQLDFDIIDVTFTDKGEDAVIPVVADPIDIIPDVDPAPYPTVDEVKTFIQMLMEIWEWIKSNWKWLAIAAVALIVGVPLIIAFLPSIIRFVVWCGKGLIKLLWWLVIGIAFVIASPVLLLIWIIKGFISLFKKE